MGKTIETQEIEYNKDKKTNILLINILGGLIVAAIIAIVSLAFNFNEKIARLEEQVKSIKEKLEAIQLISKSNINGDSIITIDPSKLEDIIKSKHSQYVKTSYNESNCFTDVDLEKFRNNRIPNQIVADLMKNNAFIDLIISIKGMSPTERQELLERCSKIAKLTWVDLGKVSPNGQTVAGNQAELLISEAIVNKIQSMMSLSVEEIKKKYK